MRLGSWLRFCMFGDRGDADHRIVVRTLFLGAWFDEE
jgi:hypothetical protein